MLLKEFEELTGFYPSAKMFDEIHKEYLTMGCDKKKFCELYKSNKYGLASKIQHRTDSVYAEKVQLVNTKIELLNAGVEVLKARLDMELAWVPYFTKNMLSKEEYADLSSKIALITTDYAKSFIEKTFGFNKKAINVITYFPVQEINKYKKIRNVENKFIDRRPLYESTDYNYILFDCCGILYECRDGELNIV